MRGPRAASRVGEKLFSIAGARQVLCVTHLPQIAALADRQYYISKESYGGRTYTRVEPLDLEGRIRELTRLTAGDSVTEAARQNAAAAQSNARFVANDCLRFIAKRPYDEMLANLPFGNRVGSHENNRQLYAGILDRLPQWLRPGGIAILYTMEFTLLKTLLRDRPAISLLSQARTNAGGLTPMAFILQVGQPN